MNTVVHFFLSLDKTDLHRLQKLQNKAMRVILRCNKRTSISSMLNNLQWLSVSQKIELNVLIFIFKMIKGLMPDYLFKFVHFNHEIHSYNTKNKNNLHIEKTNHTMNSLTNKGFNLFNELLVDIKNSGCVKQFKLKCIEYILGKVKINILSST